MIKTKIARIIGLSAVIVLTGGLIVDWLGIYHYAIKEPIMWIKITEICMGLFAIPFLVKEIFK